MRFRIRKPLLSSTMLLILCAACGSPEGENDLEVEQESDSAAATTSWQTCMDVGDAGDCAQDKMEVNRILMVKSSGRHAEVIGNHVYLLTQGHGGRIETIFSFGANPGPGRWPMYHCRYGQFHSQDFVSTDPNCEGHANDGLIGFSLPGGRPVSRCRVRGGPLDIFLSWDTRCEGQHVVGVIGYAR